MAESKAARGEAGNAGTRMEFRAVLAAELGRIEQVRRNKRARQAEAGRAREAERREPAIRDQAPAEGEGLVALALSGGGIRSAAFNLGVMQAFANCGLLARFDYLSSVSGGGYIASALTWFLSSVWAGESGRRLGTGHDDHPLGRREAGGKTGTANDRIDHIRCMGNYLRPTPALWTGSAAALVLRAIVLTILMWFPPLVLALVLLDGVGTRVPSWEPAKAVPRAEAPLASTHAETPQASIRIEDSGAVVSLAVPGAAISMAAPQAEADRVGDHLGWLWWPAGFCGVMLVFGVFLRARYAPREVLPGRRPSPYFRRLNQQQALGKWLVAGLGCALIAVLPWIVDYLGGWVAASGGFVGAVVAFLGLFGRLPSGLASRFQPVLLRLGVVLAAYGLLVAALWVPQHVFAAGWIPGGRWGLLGVTLLLAGLAVLGAGRARLNHLSLHRLYRDRLMEAFLPDPEPFADKGAAAVRELGSGVWEPAEHADAQPLSRMCDADSLGPYHLINANVILVNSENAGIRGRGGESFLLSPLWSGCDRTGWCETSQLFPPENREPEIQLSSAMAVSGAAANPNTGVGGSGLTRSAVVSALMMLFNIRLGYWVPNPNPKARAGAWVRRPRFIDPGVRAVLGVTHDEASPFLELSDGGHFENLGVYELIRRRVPLIVVCDAGQDGDYAFADLGNAIERVRVDFGVHIRFDCSDFRLGDVVPGKANGEDRLGGRFGLATRGFALARVSYPPLPPGRQAVVGPAGDAVEDAGAFEGCLVYIKATLIDGLGPDVFAYRAAEATFPHQTTGDQFFDEAQFEAYRGLGYGLADGLLDQLRQDGTALRKLVTPTPEQPPAKDWLARLAALIPGSRPRPAAVTPLPP